MEQSPSVGRVPRPTTSKNIVNEPLQKIPKTPDPKTASSTKHTDAGRKKRFWSCCYDRETNTCCGRTPKGWLQIITYAIMYLIFLATYTMIFLFGSLTIIKSNESYLLNAEKVDLMSYMENGIGLTAVPPAENTVPLIWYRSGVEGQYDKYVQALDSLLDDQSGKKKPREKRNLDSLGPCGERPYGYGSRPCVLIRINKQKGWSATPLQVDSANALKAPNEVRNWLKLSPQKLWLNCDGFYPWDKEHLGTVRYYPDPPGFDPGMFPLNMSRPAPLVAVQFSNFTLGMSISVQCKLWYESGTSSLEFVLYVAQPRTY